MEKEDLPMFRNSVDVRPVAMLSGIVRRTLTYGDRMLLVEFTIEAGASFPEHSHPYEQIGYLCSGAGTLWIGEDAMELTQGSSWCIPSNVVHKANFTRSSVVIDVFSPVREDYLEGVS